MYQLKLTRKKVNKANKFTKDCIVSALFQMLETNKLEDISISEIVKKAGVSRMGFYRNYSSKEEIIEKFILDIFLDTIAEIESNRPLKLNVIDGLITTLIHFQKHSDKIKLLLNRNMEALLYSCYHKAFYHLYNYDQTSRIRNYTIQMLIGELFNLEISWVKNGMVETPERLAKIYYRILKLRADSL